MIVESRERRSVFLFSIVRRGNSVASSRHPRALNLIAVYRVELRSLRDALSRANQRAQVNAPENASRYGIWALIDCP